MKKNPRTKKTRSIPSGHTTAAWMHDDARMLAVRESINEVLKADHMNWSKAEKKKLEAVSRMMQKGRTMLARAIGKRERRK